MSLARVVTVDTVVEHPNADRLALATVDGWTVVVAKDEFHEGDKCIFIEIDTFIPESVAHLLTAPGHKPHVFRGVTGERLRTKKIRGVLSQGLLLPCDQSLAVGTDVTDLLGIIKWERDTEERVFRKFAHMPGCSNFPKFIRRTDQPNLQNCMQVLRDTHPYEATLKVDGSSITAYYYNGLVGCCSRNINLDLDIDNPFVNVWKELDIFSKLQALGKNIAVQGELMGPGVCGNREDFATHLVFIFDVWDIGAQQYMSRQDRLDTLAALGISDYQVPVITVNTLAGMGLASLADAFAFVDRASLINPVAEGVVFKRTDGLASFKVVNPKYLLAKGS